MLRHTLPVSKNGQKWRAKIYEVEGGNLSLLQWNGYMSHKTLLPFFFAAALVTGCGKSQQPGTSGTAAAPAGSSSQLLINGAGATFPYPMYSKWFHEYRTVDPSVSFNYQSIGSGGGHRQIVERTVDFGASDGPMSDESLKSAPAPILHIPTVAGGDVLTYNLPGSPTLQLDGPTVAGIFLGKITNWNDPAIAAQNPSVKLPTNSIVVVHRSDGSGTTYIFVDYLSSVSKDWESGPGRGTSVNWPVGIGAEGKRRRDRADPASPRRHRLRRIGLCGSAEAPLRQHEKLFGKLHCSLD